MHCSYHCFEKQTFFVKSIKDKEINFNSVFFISLVFVLWSCVVHVYICALYAGVCAVCSCVCPCLCMWRPEEDSWYFVLSLSYSLKIGSLSESGVCWVFFFSARLTGQQAAVSGFPVSAFITLKWQACNCHDASFTWVSGFQTLILVQQALLLLSYVPSPALHFLT